MSSTQPAGCPFCAILNGEEPGVVIARDDSRKVAVIQSIHPESIIHWMAVPTEHMDSTEMLEQSDRTAFLDLLDFAVEQAHAQALEYPQLQKGFSLKMHFGSFETIPHAKVHILTVE